MKDISFIDYHSAEYGGRPIRTAPAIQVIEVSEALAPKVLP